jgi:hypothetical protein
VSEPATRLMREISKRRHRLRGMTSSPALKSGQKRAIPVLINSAVLAMFPVLLKDQPFSAVAPMRRLRCATSSSTSSFNDVTSASNPVVRSPLHGAGVVGVQRVRRVVRVGVPVPPVVGVVVIGEPVPVAR